MILGYTGYQKETQYSLLYLIYLIHLNRNPTTGADPADSLPKNFPELETMFKVQFDLIMIPFVYIIYQLDKKMK